MPSILLQENEGKGFRGPMTNYYLAAVLVLCAALGLAACASEERALAEDGDRAVVTRENAGMASEYAQRALARRNQSQRGDGAGSPAD